MRCSAIFISACLMLGLDCLAQTMPQVVFIDGSKPGRTFEGIGTLSAGASSKLLIDYPEPQRSEILDLLFKPKHGASLQHLKVEIGGDVNSTCGTEPAFAHTREEFAAPDAAKLQRGYETWLMLKARERAPKILFDALQWGAPGWIGGGKFYSQDNADFIAAFHAGMRKHFQLDVAYQGIWNETMYDAEWIKLLRQTLDRADLQDVKIGAADQTGAGIWEIAAHAERDPELSRAIHAFGEHYVSYQSNAAAIRSGKPLWAAEDGPWQGDWYGATKLAKFYNRAYIEGKMTRIITWSLITSYYDILPLPKSGLMRANEPWSGYYEVQPAIWAVAHTTQFTDPGWVYVDGGCGYLEPFGSYVTLRSPDGHDFTIVIETMDSPYTGISRSREIAFRLSDDFPQKQVHVWTSSMREQFRKVTSLDAKDRVIRFRFGGESIYTISTTTGQQKGGVEPRSIPESRTMPLPFRDAFDGKPAHALPAHFIDQSGVFEVVDRPGGKGGCLRQVVPHKGIEWRLHGNPEPYTIMGDERWRDYQVETDTLLGGAGTASVFGRITKVGTKAEPPEGYWLNIDQTGNWKLNRRTDVLKTGKAAFAVDRWQRIGLRFAGNRITVLINGKQQATVSDDAYRHGLAGLGCSWLNAYFDNFTVQPVSP